MGKQLYCVVGISKFTRERMAISPPCREENALKILDREKAIPARKRVYFYMRLVKYPFNKNIFGENIL